mmetsp:Transcript_708/g.1462  ORF Transcript_708/g.1462 Transcript_708/m.1462 type:complete len:186 (-) Transcript_708:229-786(-)
MPTLAFVLGALSFSVGNRLATQSARADSRSLHALASASTLAPLVESVDPLVSTLCAITVCTGSSQHETSTVQTLISEVLMTHTSGRRRGTVQVRPAALRTCHGARARALLSLNPSAGWMHEPRLQSDVRVFEEDAPVTYVPTQMVRAVSVDERTIVSALRQMHDGRLSSVRSDEHFTVLEAFYSL